jgi:hypothetical protein
MLLNSDQVILSDNAGTFVLMPATMLAAVLQARGAWQCRGKRYLSYISQQSEL